MMCNPNLWTLIFDYWLFLTVFFHYVFVTDKGCWWGCSLWWLILIDSNQSIQMLCACSCVCQFFSMKRLCTLGVSHVISSGSVHFIDAVCSFQGFSLLFDWLEFLNEVGIGWTSKTWNGQSFWEGVGCEEFMAEDLIDSQTTARFQLKHFRNKIFCSFANSNTVREAVAAHFNLCVGCLHIVSFEGWPTNKQSIGNDSQTPYINFIRMSFAFQYLRCNVIWSPTRGLPSLILRF